LKNVIFFAGDHHSADLAGYSARDDDIGHQERNALWFDCADCCSRPIRTVSANMFIRLRARWRAMLSGSDRERPGI
jgi:hypothetical protein